MANDITKGSRFDFPAPSGEFLSRSGSRYREVASIKDKIRGREADLKDRELRQGAFSSRVYAAQVGLGWASFLKPLLVIGLIVLFVVGPGVIALSALLKAAPWYLWLGGIVLFLVVIRR